MNIKKNYKNLKNARIQHGNKFKRYNIKNKKWKHKILQLDQL